MRQDFRIVGSGGQGVILLSVILAGAYGMYEGKEVSQTQSYGPEARGGACRAELVISDAEIDYVKVDRVGVYVAFNEVGFQKYAEDILPETVIFADSTLVGEALLAKYAANTVHAIPATRIAEETFQPFATNIVMLGYMAAKLDNLNLAAAQQAMESLVPPKLLDVNRDALRHGYEMGV